MARSTYPVPGSHGRVGLLLVVLGLGEIAIGVQRGRDSYRLYRSQSVAALPEVDRLWEWLREWMLTPAVVCTAGLVTLIVGALMVRNSRATRRLLRIGDPATARVVELVHTGALVRNQPKVRVTMLVEPPGQLAYAATTTVVVPVVLLGQVQPGAFVAVRVDPEDPHRVAIDLQTPDQAAAG